MARTSRKQQKQSLSQLFSEPAKLYNVAIYARLSVEDNGKGSDSIESQIEYLEAFIANDPTMRKVAVFIDNGFTGTNFMRPEFQRMIEAARHGDINCIVVKDLSRLGRNYVETGEFLEKVCPFIGLRFIAVNDHYDSEMASANSQLVASLSNIINDFYAKDISRKVYSAIKAKMENGEYIGSWEKYGYLKDPEDKNRLIVNPETAPIVQQIFGWRSEGISPSPAANTPTGSNPTTSMSANSIAKRRFFIVFFPPYCLLVRPCRRRKQILWSCALLFPRRRGSRRNCRGPA